MLWLSLIVAVIGALNDDEQACSQQSFDTQKFHPSVELVSGCRHGNFFVMRGDTYIGPSLKATGEWSEGEVVQIFEKFVSEGDVVLDIGANVGAFTVVLGRLVGKKGVVHAFEPMPALHNLVVANAVLNGLGNVRAHNAFAGEKSSIKMLEVVNANVLYDDTPSVWASRLRWPINFGSLSWRDEDLQPLKGTYAIDHASTLSVDELRLYRCDFMKIDVEGAELDVLSGAAKTIKTYLPAIYLEDDRGEEKSASITAVLKELKYVCHSHQVPLYNHGNFKQGDPWSHESAWKVGTAVLSSHNRICVHETEKETLEKIVESWGTMPFGAPSPGVPPRTANLYQA